jgi:hypothetical protein
MASRFIMPTADVGKGLTPSDGAKLSFFITGTSTPKDTFTTETAITPNSNPVIADSNGVFPDIFITGTYKVTLTDKNDVQSGFGEADPVSETVGVGDSNNDKRYGPVFATVAAMTAANPVAIDGIVVNPVVGMVVGIDDYATGNKSGFLIGTVVATATGTADGGSFIDLANGLQWEQSFTNTLNVKQFGAKGDGTTDDLVALTAAHAFSSDVDYPGGVYGVTGNILDTSSSGNNITGAGYESTEFKLLANVSTVFRFAGTGSGPTFHSSFNTMKGIKFNANGFNGVMVEFNRADRNELIEVYFFEVQRAIVNVEHWDSSFYNCRFQENGDLSGGFPAVDMQARDSGDSDTGCNNLVMVDCQFEAQPHIALRMGQHSRNNRIIACKFHGDLPTPSVSDMVVLISASLNKFIGCQWSNGLGKFFNCNTATLNTISGCSFSGTPSSAAITFASSSDNNIVNDCMFESNSKSVVATGSSNNIWGDGNRSTDATKIEGSLVQLPWGAKTLTDVANSSNILTLSGAPVAAANFDSLRQRFFHKNSAGSQVTGSEFLSTIQDITSASEDVDLVLKIMIAGALTEIARLASATSTFKVADSAFDGVHFQLGIYHLWVDATGDLRIKSSAPTSDTDGVVVGTQT